MAPGVGVYSALPLDLGGYGTLSGTSMAAPHVAGVAALLRGIAPAITPDQMAAVIRATAQPRTDAAFPASPNYGYGYGLVQAGAAVAAVRQASAPVQLTLRPQGPWDPASATVTLQGRSLTLILSPDASGRVEFPPVPPGAYTLTARAPLHLRQSRALTVWSQAVDLGTLELPVGDVNQDGTIDSADLDQILNDYGTVNPATELVPDGRMDLLDLAAAARNWGRRDQ